MPDGDKGKMEVAISAREGRIWAIVESQPEEKKNGIYRSEDYGQTWEHLTSDTNLTGRPWYFNHIRADPQDADTLWVLNFEIWRSVDGGKNYQVMAGPHADYHDLWIDPTNTQRMILGGDGGACVSLNGAESWSTIYNQPTAEFYHATTDNRFPYRVYGAQQDNTTMSIISRSDNDAITMTEWYEVGGGESGYIAVSPTNPNVILAGAQSGMLTRYDHERKQELDIAVWPESPRGHGAEDYKFRTNWTSPMVHSPHDPTVVYYGSHVVHKTTSEGRAWEVISPDLTRADPETMHASGGNITKDNSGAEVYATVFTIAPSPLDAGVIWAGSDDGLVHVTRDGGADLGRRDAVDDPRLGADEHHRSLAARRRDRLPGGHPLQERRLPALPLQDERLRQDVDEDHQRHPRRRLHPRHPRGPDPRRGCSTPGPRPASTSRSTTAATGRSSAATCRSSQSTTSSSRTTSC